MLDWYKGNNPDGLTQRQFFGDPIHPPEAWRTVGERLKEIDAQGMDGTLMFPTLASAVEERLGNFDVGAMCAIMHSLNQWMLENWEFNCQDRIFTAPVISLADVDWAVKELEWALENGARTVLVRPAPVPNVAGSRSPAFEEFDPFWARVNESKIFVTMHASDSGYDKFIRMWAGGTEYLPFDPDAFSFALKPAARAISDTMTALICHGLFDRFPQVRVAAMENGASWVGDCLENLHKVHKMFPQEFKSDPVEQFKEHIYVAPFYEDSLDDLKHLIGAERVLFGSDYPHPEGVEDPVSFLDTLDGYNEAEQQMVMGGNLKALLERPLA
jgi:predicted TIM-barrel fold metal-dependent hydrolase